MNLTCKEFTAMIPAFLEDGLTDQELDEFLRHWDECESCRDELSTHYLVMEGLERLETGETFDLQKDLRAEIESAKIRLARRTQLAQASFGIEIITIAAFILAMSIFLFA